MSEKDDLNSRLIRELEETLKSEGIEIDEVEEDYGDDLSSEILLKMMEYPIDFIINI